MKRGLRSTKCPNISSFDCFFFAMISLIFLAVSVQASHLSRKVHGSQLPYLRLAGSELEGTTAPARREPQWRTGNMFFRDSVQSEFNDRNASKQQTSTNRQPAPTISRISGHIPVTPKTPKDDCREVRQKLLTVRDRLKEILEDL